MVRATYTLHIDADRSEVFDADEAVTADVGGSPLVECTRGKEQLTQLSPPRAGDLDFVLNNGPQGGNGTYSPSGAFGLAAGQLARFRATDPTTGTVHDLARVVIQRPRQVPGFPTQHVALTGYGTLSRLPGKRVSTALYSSITTDVAIGHLLDAAGWPKEYRESVLDEPQLAGYWRFDEATGTVADDSSPHGRDGTYNNTPTLGQPGLIDDPDGRAAVFTAAQSEDVSVPDGAHWDIGAQNFALEAWVKFATTTGNRPIIAHDEGPGNTNKWILYYDGANLNFHVNNPAAGPGITPISYAWSPGTTVAHHVVLRRDGVGWSLWIDGVQVATDPTAATVPAIATTLTIASAELGAWYFDGTIDEVAIYIGGSDPITGAHILQHYARGLDSPRHLDTGQTTLEWWWLDEADAFEAALKLQSTEGPGADLYEDGTGAVVFRDRHARLTDPRSTAAQSAFTAAAAAAEPKLSALNYDEGLRNVINEAVLKVVRRTAGSEAFQWQSQQPLSALAPGATASTSARLDDDGPGQSLVTGLLTTSPYASTLAAAIPNTTDLSCTIATGTAPTITTNTVLDIEGEYLLVSSRVTGSPNDTLNFTGGRGRYGTTAASHLSGVAVRTRAFIANGASNFAGANVTADVTVSIDRTSGQSVRFTFTNNGAVPAYPFARLYGVQVTVQETYQIANTVDASASIAEHGRRSYTLPIYEEIDVDVAQDFANAVVGWYQSGRPTVEIAVRGDADATRMTACLAREVGDRVSVVEPETGVNDHFWVERITHRVDAPAQHLTTFGCEVASSGFGVAAIVGTTQVGSATERVWY